MANPRIAMLVYLSIVTLLLPAMALDDGAMVSLHVEDSPVEPGYWKASVGDVQMSLDFQPAEGGSSSSTWSASLQHSVGIPGAAEPLRQPLDTLEEPQPTARLTAATAEGKTVRYTLSLGQFTLVRQPALDYDSARQRCEMTGGHVAIFSNPEELRQLRELMDLHPSDQEDKEGDAFLDIDNGFGQPLEWRADEITGKACLAMVQSGELLLRSCSEELAFFCEQPDGTSTPTR